MVTFTCVEEAALYGDLVKYLRDRWAEERAAKNHTSFEEEQKHLDEIIKTWFFTPQRRDLYGYTPRDVIREEEQGIAHIIPKEHEHELFDDPDCSVCQAMLHDPILNQGDWQFGVAPEITLLDEYDPEGYDAKWAEEMEDFKRFNEEYDRKHPNGNGHSPDFPITGFGLPDEDDPDFPF